MDMDSYIVRIYRRLFRDDAASGQETPEAMVGQVENAAGTERRRFRSAHELWTILAQSSDAPSVPPTESDPAPPARQAKNPRNQPDGE